MVGYVTDDTYKRSAKNQKTIKSKHFLLNAPYSVFYRTLNPNETPEFDDSV